MEKVVLKATKRDVLGKQVKALRRSGKLPGVIYGRHTEPVSISLDLHTASQVLSKVGSSSLITLDVDGTEYPALVRERQRDYIKDRLTHVDFLAVSLTEKIRAEVRIELVGRFVCSQGYRRRAGHGPAHSFGRVLARRSAGSCDR